jgi:hypothetical protein
VCEAAETKKVSKNNLPTRIARAAGRLYATQLSVVVFVTEILGEKVSGSFERCVQVSRCNCTFRNCHLENPVLKYVAERQIGLADSCTLRCSYN